MTNRLAFGFARKNLRANKYLEIPFIIASSVMLILFNIMASLLQNEYVSTRHEALPMFMQFGVVVAFIFTFIFVVYANRFLIKRRNKEFALYGVLGLEKRHIRKIIFLEHLINYSVIAVITIAGGFLFGKLAFFGINRLVGDTTGTVMDYPFSLTAFVLTLCYIAFLFLSMFFINSISIKSASPVELLGREHRGEGEPKNRITLLAIGAMLLIGGYVIALTTEGTLRSIYLCFVAVVLVIFATYALFVSFSVFLLKMQQRSTGYFYKAKNFLSVPGMLYRMKSSAVGLASVCILSTGVIVTLATTLSIYRNIETAVSNSMNRDYNLSVDVRGSAQEIEGFAGILKQMGETAVGAENMENAYVDMYSMAPVQRLEDGSISMATRENTKDIPMMAVFETLDAFNAESDTDYTLGENEILFSASKEKYFDRESLVMDGTSYQLRKLPGSTMGSDLGIDAILVVVPSVEDLIRFSNVYGRIIWRRKHTSRLRFQSI